MNLAPIICLCLLNLLPLSEQMEEVKALYYRGAYEQVLQAAEGILETNPTLESETIIELRKHIAFSCVALGRTREAKQEFTAILEIDSTLTFDPQFISPKIIQVFEQARAELLEPLPIDTDTLPPITGHPTTSLSLRTAALRSIAFPGVGQLYAGKKAKGWIFLLGEGMSLGGLFISHILTQKAHQAYLDAQVPEEIEARYQTYNNWFQARTAFGVLSVGIWVSAPLDMLLFPPRWAKNR